jgi:hypothetical protein
MIAPTELVLTVTREGTAPVRLTPERIVVTPATFGLTEGAAPAGRYRLSAPHGWPRRLSAPLEWTLVPDLLDLDRRHALRLEYVSEDDSASRSWTLPIRVEVDLTTTFEPKLHAVPFPNRASAIGDVTPTGRMMRRTYVGMRGALGNALYAGLYRNIVYLRAEGPTRGGLCTGMARWAIACSQGEVEQPPTVEEIALYHGRQLNDRALLASLSWFLRASPRAAFEAVRADALRDGVTRRALDVAVPKPWRRDLPRALVQEGHTVVPFRVRQMSPEVAFLDVYDPNRPPEGDELNVQTIEFKLRENRYSYRHLASFDDGRIGMIAAPQAAYATPGTAYLAALGSALMRLVGGRKAGTA